MYRSLPGGLHDAGPNPQPELPPALPQRLHLCSSSSSLLRTYCFWPTLRCTELGCILLSSFSPETCNQSPGSLFGSPAASFWRPVALRSPASRRGCPSRSASLRKMRLLILLSASSRGSHANILVRASA